jgi:hypothetical protein
MLTFAYHLQLDICTFSPCSRSVSRLGLRHRTVVCQRQLQDDSLFRLTLILLLRQGTQAVVTCTLLDAMNT